MSYRTLDEKLISHNEKLCKLSSDITKRADDISLDSQIEYFKNKIKQLEAQLEEERQENASLRGGSMDDYDRWAE